MFSAILDITTIKFFANANLSIKVEFFKLINFILENNCSHLQVPSNKEIFLSDFTNCGN